MLYATFIEYEIVWGVNHCIKNTFLGFQFMQKQLKLCI